MLIRIITLVFTILITNSYASTSTDLQIKNVENQQLSINKNRKINLHRAIERYTKEYRLPSEGLFASLLVVESNLDPCAISRVGAVGLSQLMPSTAEDIGITDRFDVHQSLWGGASVLRSALNITNGDITKSLGLYNWGSKSLKTPFRSWPKETRHYVKKITRNQKKFQSSHWKKHIPEYIDYKNARMCNINQRISNR